MAIQFLCPGCNQPIEVDAEHAGKSAACPYCRQVVAVPLESTYRPDLVVAARPGPSLPPAQPAADVVPAPVLRSPLPAPPESLHVGPTLTPRQRRARTYGVYALVCAGIAVALLVALAIAAMGVAAQDPGFRALLQSRVDQLDPAEMAQAQKELMRQLIRRPRLVGLNCGCELFAVVALALSITSVVQSRARNWPGIVALLASGLLVSCLCAGALFWVAGGTTLSP